jgi:hypothetical protein
VLREFEQLLVLPLVLVDRRPLLVGDGVARGKPGNPVLLQTAEQRADCAQNQIADANTAMARQDPSVQTTGRARMPVELGVFLGRPGHCQIIPRASASTARGVDGAAHRSPLRA